MSNTHPTSRQIRAKLKHPVIDCDGHVIEFMPFLHEYVAKIGGASMVDTFKKMSLGEQMLVKNVWHSQTPAERQYRHQRKYAFHALPSGNTKDRATVMLPRLLYERMDEFGVDFSVLYPTAGLEFMYLRDDELRRVATRALNTMQADIYREFRDRLTPAATIPSRNPKEAVEELEYCVKTLGLKAIMISGNVIRQVPIVAEKAPEFAQYTQWCDYMAMDSKYDYDPFWAKCVELGVAPTAHAGSQNIGSRKSISSYVYNHIGSFAEAHHAFCKAVFLGGVALRFPTLRIGFLEGGVGWAASMLEDTIGHWKKRNREAIKQLDPAKLDVDMLKKYFLSHGANLIKGRESEIDALLARYRVDHQPAADVDEFAACGVKTEEDIRHQFRNFFFGCEADDPMNALAFRGPRKSHLHAMFSSDIAHWDVPDMSETVEEAYELVEEGLIDDAAFRDFMFLNPARLHAGMNPDFFKGTRVEAAVAALSPAEMAT